MKNLTKTTLLLSGAMCATSAFAQQTEKLNVLYIMTDQQNYDMMSCMAGDKYLSTPNMDRIAAQGYNFTNAYCANPVSMPSRFSLSTGMPASSVGLKANSTKGVDEEKRQFYASNSLGNLFARAGYESIYVGKTHLYGSLSSYGYQVLSQEPYDEGCAVAVDYLDSRKESDKPFFMFVSFMNPHDICYNAGLDPRYPDRLKGAQAVATRHYLEEIKANLTPEEYAAQIPPRMPNEAFMVSKPNGSGMPDPENLKGSGRDYNNWTEAEQDTFRWMYYRLTESVDALIGQVLDALDRTGEAENTIIVFTSDHGELLGAHGYTTKSLPFNEAQRIPFMFAGPNIKKNVMDSETLTCNGYDLIPTLCDFAGIEAPDYLPGISLKPALTGNKSELEERKYIVTETSNTYQITDGVNKLSVFEFVGAPRIFVNLEDDPREEINALKDPRYAATIAEMQKELDKYLSDNNLKLKSQAKKATSRSDGSNSNSPSKKKKSSSSKK